MTPIIVDAVRAVSRPNETSDLFMVEVIEMEHKSVLESKLVRGIVLDHGFRHPGFFVKSDKINRNFFLIWLKLTKSQWSIKFKKIF